MFLVLLYHYSNINILLLFYIYDIVPEMFF